jgi:hypothetical protein
MSAQAAATHEMFVDRLGTSAGSYTATEVANAIAAPRPQDRAGAQVHLGQVVQQQSAAVDARLQMEFNIAAEDDVAGCRRCTPRPGLFV